MAFTKKEARDIERLVKLAQKNDAESFGELYDKFVVLIYRYVYYRVDRGEAEDLTELVFLKAWENRRRYKKQNGNSFSSWIFRIAHNVVVDFYRARFKNETTELSDEIISENQDINPVFQAQSKFDQYELTEVIRQLPQNQQQVIVLKFVSELKNSEIAEVINKTEGAVRIIQFRALARLKKLLDQSKEKKRNKADFAAFKTMPDV